MWASITHSRAGCVSEHSDPLFSKKSHFCQFLNLIYKNLEKCAKVQTQFMLQVAATAFSYTSVVLSPCSSSLSRTAADPPDDRLADRCSHGDTHSPAVSLPPSIPVSFYPLPSHLLWPIRTFFTLSGVNVRSGRPCRTSELSQGPLLLLDPESISLGCKYISFVCE